MGRQGCREPCTSKIRKAPRSLLTKIIYFLQPSERKATFDFGSPLVYVHISIIISKSITGSINNNTTRELIDPKKRRFICDYTKPSYKDNAWLSEIFRLHHRRGEWRTDLDDGWILLAAFDEFFISQLSIFIFVHISEYLIDTLKEWECRSSS